MKELAVIVVAYNTKEILKQCLTACYRSIEGLDATIVVVDNASHDGTAEMVSSCYPNVQLIRSEFNRGFAAGNNLAFNAVEARYYLLLNSDAFPDPDSIRLGLEKMKAEPNVAAAGGLLINEDGRPAASARMFPSLLNDFLALSGLAAKFPKSRFFGRFDRTWSDVNEACYPDWVPGAFTFLRGDVIKELKGFDERFFLYYEEVDLCKRMREMGYEVAYWPDLRVVHIGGVSSRKVQGAVVSRNGSQLTVWRMRAGMLYFRKHHGLLGAWASFALERYWHGLRAYKNRQEKLKYEESRWVVDSIEKAWNDTAGGRVSPPTPW